MSRKLTHDEQVEAIAKVNPNIEVLGSIVGNAVNVLCRCKVCNHKWNAIPSNLKRGQGCPKCGIIKRANKRRLPHTKHVAEIKKVNPNVEILEEIKNAHKKVLCKCKICHYEWNAIPSNLKRGQGCPSCAGNIKLTHNEQVAAITEVNPNIEVLGEIISSHAKVLCKCKICSHEWRVAPYSIKSGNGCPECAKIRVANTRKLTHIEQIEAIAKINPNVEILGKIINTGTKVLTFCKVCGHVWKTTPQHLKRGYGCPECKKIKIGNTRRLPHTEQAAAIKNVNPDVEVLGEIKGVHTKVLCRCMICHHEWEARPSNLKSGKGCPRCAKYGFLSKDVGKLYIMVDNLEAPTIMKIGVSVNEDKRSKEVLKSTRKAGVTIPALYVAKTWEGPTDLMQRIESMMHENYAEWNIKFPTKFDGFTEFFYYTPETAGVFDAIDETYYTVVNQF